MVYSSVVQVQFDLSIYLFGKSYTDYCYWLYSKPHHRIPAYLIGIAFALLLPATPEFRQQLSRRSKVVLSGSAYAATAVLAFLVFCSMGALADEHAWSEGENYLYIVW